MEAEGWHRSSCKGQSVSLLREDTKDPADTEYETDSDTICVTENPHGWEEFVHIG